MQRRNPKKRDSLVQSTTQVVQSGKQPMDARTPTSAVLPWGPTESVEMAALESAKSGCVDENVLLDFLAGRLEGPALENVERHMDECSDCRMLLAYASTRSGMRSSRGALEAEFARSIPRVGQRIGGRFRLERLLGWGAMGVVFEA